MLKSGRKTVAVANTRERLQVTSEQVQSVTLIAIDGNTGVVWCGGPETSGVSGSEHGYPLAEDGGFAELRLRTYTGIDLSDIWIDAPNAGDGVTWEAVV